MAPDEFGWVTNLTVLCAVIACCTSEPEAPPGPLDDVKFFDEVNVELASFEGWRFSSFFSVSIVGLRFNLGSSC